jgi:hypothetical protein
MKEWDNVCETITKTFYTKCWQLFAGYYHFYKKKIGQLKNWVGQVLFLVSCPKGEVNKNVNVEACIIEQKTIFH